MPKCYALHCDLLRLRKEDAAFSGQHAGAFDGAVLGSGGIPDSLFQ